MTGSEPHFTTDQRRARLVRRHGLGDNPQPDVLTATRSLVGLHATDPASVFLSGWARVPEVTRDVIEAAFFTDRSVVRVMGMRRTWWAVPAETFPVVVAAAGSEVAARERRRTVKALVDQGVDDAERWMRHLEAATVAALDDLEPALTAELAAALPDLQTKIGVGSGRWATEVALSTRVVLILAAEGRIVRSRPRGTWVSSQYRWASRQAWLPPLDDLDPVDARAELARLYLARFGPATETDVTWWTGWTKTATRAALAAVGAVEVSTEEGPALVLPDDADPDPDPGRWVALLPSLDPTIMGWKERDWYLGPHYPALFDSAGNAGPTVWVDGKVVGGWAQRADAAVIYELVEGVDASALKEIEAEADRLTEWLSGKVVTPRFGSPLHRRLVDSA